MLSKIGISNISELEVHGFQHWEEKGHVFEAVSVHQLGMKYLDVSYQSISDAQFHLGLWLLQELHSSFLRWLCPEPTRERIKRHFTIEEKEQRNDGYEEFRYIKLLKGVAEYIEILLCFSYVIHHIKFLVRFASLGERLSGRAR